MQGGDDNSSASETLEAEGDRGLYAEIAAENGRLLSEIDIEPTTSSLLSQLDVWHDTNDLLEIAQYYTPKPSGSNYMRPHTSSSPPVSTELLSNYTMSSPASPRN